MYTTKQELLENLQHLRRRYFTYLEQVQELYLETLMPNAQHYTISNEKEIIGYYSLSTTNGETALIEFYIHPENWTEYKLIFLVIHEQTPFSTVSCLSFNGLLLKCCLELNMNCSTQGKLFRDFLPTTPESVDEFEIKIATSEDYTTLVQYTDALYESESELDYLVTKQKTYLFYKNSSLIGAGFLYRVFEDSNYYDIGMWIHTPFRKMGYGTKIISYLKELCLNNNTIPIAACLAFNTPSQKTLEKNGFRNRYDLLSFRFLP